MGQQDNQHAPGAPPPLASCCATSASQFSLCCQLFIVRGVSLSLRCCSTQFVGSTQLATLLATHVQRRGCPVKLLLLVIKGC